MVSNIFGFFRVFPFIEFCFFLGSVEVVCWFNWCKLSIWNSFSVEVFF